MSSSILATADPTAPYGTTTHDDHRALLTWVTREPGRCTVRQLSAQGTQLLDVLDVVRELRPMIQSVTITLWRINEPAGEWTWTRPVLRMRSNRTRRTGVAS